MSLPPAVLEHMEAHIDDTRVPSMLATSIICGVLSIFVIIARIFSRRMVRLQLKADDWFAIVSQILYLGTPITLSLATKWGGGRHIILLTNPRAFSICMIIAELLYFINVWTIKLSLLYLFKRIFPIRWFERALYAVGAVVTAIAIAAVLVSCMQCIPLNKLWDPTVSGQCIDFGAFALALAVLNIVTDFVILALPMPVVWGLKISSRKKWMVTVTFIFGGCAFVVCILRLAFILQVNSTYDPTWDNAPSGIISCLELFVGLFACCFPTYKPIYKHFRYGDAYHKGSSTQQSYASQQSKRSYPSNPSNPSNPSINKTDPFADVSRVESQNDEWEAPPDALGRNLMRQVQRS